MCPLKDGQFSTGRVRLLFRIEPFHQPDHILNQLKSASYSSNDDNISRFGSNDNNKRNSIDLHDNNNQPLLLSIPETINHNLMNNTNNNYLPDEEITTYPHDITYDESMIEQLRFVIKNIAAIELASIHTFKANSPTASLACGKYIIKLPVIIIFLLEKKNLNKIF